MWVCSFNSASDNPYREPPFVQILYLSYNDNLPNWTYVFHHHEAEYELAFVVEGKGLLNVDSQKIPLEAGSICIMPPDILHYYSAQKEDAMKYYTMKIPAESKAGDLQNFIQGIRKEPAVVFANNYLPYIKTTFLVLGEIYQSSGRAIDETFQSVCLGLLMLTKKLFQNQAMVVPAGPHSYANDILWYLNRHIGEKITLESLAQHFSVSPSHLGRIFRDAYHVSPITYLIQCRIICATEFLLKTDSSVTEIAQTVGYDNVTHFSHLFTDRIGCTPSEFRERNKKPPFHPKS